MIHKLHDVMLFFSSQILLLYSLPIHCIGKPGKATKERINGHVWGPHLPPNQVYLRYCDSVFSKTTDNHSLDRSSILNHFYTKKKAPPLPKLLIP